MLQTEVLKVAVQRSHVGNRWSDEGGVGGAKGFVRDAENANAKLRVLMGFRES